MLPAGIQWNKGESNILLSYFRGCVVEENVAEQIWERRDIIEDRGGEYDKKRVTFKKGCIELDGERCEY